MYLFRRSELFDLKPHRGERFFDFFAGIARKKIKKTLAASPSFAAEGGERGGG